MALSNRFGWVLPTDIDRRKSFVVYNVNLQMVVINVIYSYRPCRDENFPKKKCNRTIQLTVKFEFIIYRRQEK